MIPAGVEYQKELEITVFQVEGIDRMIADIIGHEK